MSNKDLDNPEVGVIAQEVNTIDLGSVGPVTYDYNNICLLTTSDAAYE